MTATDFVQQDLFSIFLSKKHARPKKILFRRFLSEAKKGSSNYCSMPCLFRYNYLLRGPSQQLSKALKGRCMSIMGKTRCNAQTRYFDGFY